MDFLVNLFFTQALNVLCQEADHRKSEQALPVPVRFILDDFATNVRIDQFPRMIASIRSRGISAMVIIQTESQLRAAYGEDGKTIIGCCDTYIYLGGNDIETASSVAQRANVSLSKILNMPVGTNWIFRRGSHPVVSRNFNLESFQKQKINDAWAKPRTYNTPPAEVGSKRNVR